MDLFSPQQVDVNADFEDQVTAMFPGLKIYLTEKVELQAIDSESQINNPTDQQVANLSFEHPDRMVKSSIFKSLYEDKKKTLEHVYNETLQGSKVDGKDPLTLKSLMLFLKMAVDILGLDTNLLNKSSSGCQLFRKLIYNYILTIIAQNIFSTMDAAFDGIKSSKKFKQDPFCLLTYLETHGMKDPWKIFRSKKSALCTYINRMRPRDVPFANWIRDAEKLMIELGQVPLPERKPDGTFETDASCPSEERGKVVYYDITASPPIITEIYMTLKDNCGSEILAVELDRDIADRTLSWQALRAIFAKYFTSTFPDQGRRGNKEGYVMVSQEEWKQMQQQQ
uniref:Uncharacterized protein n=1 Tax=Chromera velia CCMP2878 TaxID=1169474 RepID=A0A0G4FQ16_9ALVE|eukprot:Cvel_18106.t1-p1 / transcript=Cvel_18106.t1 / gene=Cvel_18106 / organism=Chromera_velia_CCMP2878 / gene_product=hypothetical protein / transcript_product=hypothetical protein / location=Cvel_scaffold1484:38958-39968(+) / protein_length=337 / sequence_SO=supercontig / SO=protein_coding / is_pseudo=false